MTFIIQLLKDPVPIKVVPASDELTEIMNEFAAIKKAVWVEVKKACG